MNRGGYSCWEAKSLQSQAAFGFYSCAGLWRSRPTGVAYHTEKGVRALTLPGCCKEKWSHLSGAWHCSSLLWAALMIAMTKAALGGKGLF